MFALPGRSVKRLTKEHETKRGIQRFFTEIAGSVRRTDLFGAILSSLIVTMVALAVARFFLVPWYYAIPAPLAYLALRIYRIQRADVLHRAERAFPQFREQLVTVRDNFSKTHEMELELERDVLDRSHDVTSAGFFDARGFSLRVITILVLFFVTGFVSQYTWQDVPQFWNVFEDQEDPQIDPNLYFWQRAYLTGVNDAADLNSTDNFYGDDEDLLEGARDVPLELQAARDALDLSRSTDVGEVEDFERFTPTRIDAAGAEYYEETIPVNKHDVVQNYFTQDE